MSPKVPQWGYALAAHAGDMLNHGSCTDFIPFPVPMPSHSLSTADPLGRDPPSTGCYFMTPTRGRLSSCTGNSPANEKLLHFSQSTPMDFLFPKAPPNSPPFLYKRTFLSFVLGTCLWFYYRVLVPACSSLLFPNKPIFAGRIIGNFLFKVNIT